MTRPKKVLVAFDGSPHSKDALRWGMYFARVMGTAVMAVKIFEPFHYSEGHGEIDIGAALALLAEQAEHRHALDVKLLEETKREALNQGVTIETELLPGNAASGLLDFAKQHQVEMIIAGTRGHGLWKNC